MPSPVVAYSRKITWPDCSPPRDRAQPLHLLEHVLVAHGVRTMRMPSRSSAFSRPRFAITVETTMSPLRWPAGFQRAARGEQHGVAIHDLAASRDENGAVGVAVEGHAEIRAVRRATRCCSGSRCSAPQFRLMLRPSGSVQIAITSAPRRRNSSGASR